jgi:FlgD Ig-like domain
MRQRFIVAAISAAASAAIISLSAGRAAAATVTLDPSKDNTLYFSATGQWSNGGGQYIFSGRSQIAEQRRAVMAFDLSGIPAGSTIQSAALTLHLSRTIFGPASLELRKLTKNWGEGVADADSNEGGGTVAGPGDATWIHTFYDTTFWTTAGGDFSAVVSATAIVDSSFVPGFFTWGSTPEMIADVQGWLDAPATNFGWLLRMATAGSGTSKRFDSREHPDPNVRPRLVITFLGPTDVPGSGTGAGRIVLEPNAPNPFAPSTSLRFALVEPALVRLGVHDASGRRVVELVSGTQPAGWHRAVWDGRDASGMRLPPGTYFARLESGGEVRVHKMTLVR